MTTWILATLACVGVFAFGLYLSRKNPSVSYTHLTLPTSQQV